MRRSIREPTGRTPIPRDDLTQPRQPDRDTALSLIVNDALRQMVWTAAIPIPVLDGLYVAMHKAHMIDQIATLHGQRLGHHKALVTVLCGASAAATTGVGVPEQAMRLFPVLGPFAAAPFLVLAGVSSIHVVGHAFHRHLSAGGAAETFTLCVSRSQRRAARRAVQEALGRRSALPQ